MCHNVHVAKTISVIWKQQLRNQRINDKNRHRMLEPHLFKYTPLNNQDSFAPGRSCVGVSENYPWSLNYLSAVWKKQKMFLPHPRVKGSIAGSLRDREVACSASDHQGSNFESCVWRTVSSQSSHHPQEVLLAQFSLYVHKGGLKPDSLHFISPFSMWPDDHGFGGLVELRFKPVYRRYLRAGPRPGHSSTFKRLNVRQRNCVLNIGLPLPFYIFTFYRH